MLAAGAATQSPRPARFDCLRRLNTRAAECVRGHQKARPLPNLEAQSPAQGQCSRSPPGNNSTASPSRSLAQPPRKAKVNQAIKSNHGLKDMTSRIASRCDDPASRYDDPDCRIFALAATPAILQDTAIRIAVS